MASVSKRMHVLLGITWLLLAFYCHLTLYNNAYSYFFDTASWRKEVRLATRSQQVEDYLGGLSSVSESSAVKNPTGLRKWPQRLCLGIRVANYNTKEKELTHSIASLVDNLDHDERESISILLLLADKDPEESVAYGKPWLSTLADKAFVYENHTNDALASHHGFHYETLESTLRRKNLPTDSPEAVFTDVITLLEKCKEIDASYVGLMTPGTHFLATKDWHQRVTDAIRNVNRTTRRAGEDWVSIKLFEDYAEARWRWSTREWLRDSTGALLLYIGGLSAVWLLCMAFGAARSSAATVLASSRNGFIKRLAPVATSMASTAHAGAAGSKPWGRKGAKMLAFGVWIPAFVALFLLAGQQEGLPFGGGAHQIREFEETRCGLGVLFQQRHLQDVLDATGFVAMDTPYCMLLRKVAKMKELSTWVMDPSITV